MTQFSLQETTEGGDDDDKDDALLLSVPASAGDVAPSYLISNQISNQITSNFAPSSDRFRTLVRLYSRVLHSLAADAAASDLEFERCASPTRLQDRRRWGGQSLAQLLTLSHGKKGSRAVDS